MRVAVPTLLAAALAAASNAAPAQAAAPAAPSAAAPSPAAPPDPQAARDALRPLAWLVGRWEGDGWSARPGGREAFHIVEEVAPAADGAALLIRGAGTAPDSAGRPQPVHTAVGLLAFDVGRRSWLWASATAAGRSITTTPEVAPDGGLRWGYLADNGARVRFAIARGADGAWEERGDVELPGGRTQQILAMRLVRAPAAR